MGLVLKKKSCRNVLILGLISFFVFSCAAKDSETAPISSESQPKNKNSKRNQMTPSVPLEMSNLQELGSVSTHDVPYVRKVIASKMMPRGSALMTSSGKLSSSGIHVIIHAATGSMVGSKGVEFEPTVDSVSSSVKNSLILASRHGHKTVAIPFIGGKIFISRIGVASEKLAEAIVRSALVARGDLQIRFVAYDAIDFGIFNKVLTQLLSEPQFNSVGTAAQVVQGNITDFNLHKASAIVNAANMEVKFGGGISGAIANATQNEVVIDQEAEALITQFNKKALELLNKE